MQKYGMVMVVSVGLMISTAMANTPLLDVGGFEGYATYTTVVAGQNGWQALPSSGYSFYVFNRGDLPGGPSGGPYTQGCYGTVGKAVGISAVNYNIYHALTGTSQNGKYKINFTLYLASWGPNNFEFRGVETNGSTRTYPFKLLFGLSGGKYTVQAFDAGGTVAFDSGASIATESKLDVEIIANFATGYYTVGLTQWTPTSWPTGTPTATWLSNNITLNDAPSVALGGIQIYSNASGSYWTLFDDLIVRDAQVATPTLSPDGGVIAGSQDVEISCSTSNAVIRYRFDGEPTQADEGHPSPVTVTVAPGQTLYAKAWATGYLPSEVKSAAYPAILFQSGFTGEHGSLTSTLPEWSIHFSHVGATHTIDNQTGKFYGNYLGAQYLVLRADQSEGVAQPFQPISAAGNRFEHTVLNVDANHTITMYHRIMLCPQSNAANSVWNVLGEKLVLDANWNKSPDMKKATLYLRIIKNATTAQNSGMIAYTGNVYGVDFAAGDHLRLALELRDGGGSDVRIAWRIYSASTGTWGNWVASAWFDPTSSTYGANAFASDWKARWNNNTYYYLEFNNLHDSVERMDTIWIDDAMVTGHLVTTAETPTFSPDGGAIFAGDKVTIGCATPDAEIHYTLNGTVPTQDSPLYNPTEQVAVNPGQTLTARAWAQDYAPSMIKSATYKAFNNPIDIPRADGSVSVDGNLSEWQASEFVVLDQNYSGTSPSTGAAYAVRWDGSTNRFYVAVKVNDPAHVFNDMYPEEDGWDDQDGVEIYLHTTGTEPYTYGSTQNTAQQYVIGLKTPASRTSAPSANVWKTFAGDFPISDAQALQIGLQAAGVEEVDGQGNPTGWLFYEVAMTAYQWLDTTGSIVSPLSLGDQVGVDAIVCDKYATNFGMKSENMLQTKYNDWRQIGLHQLAMHPADFDGDGKFSSTDIDLLFVQIKNSQNDPDYDLTGDGLVTQADMDVLVLTLCRSHYGDANGDGSVDVGDLGILAANYGGAEKTWNLGDFNGDGSVDVGDLGILAANYGASRSSFEADYAKVFGAAGVDEESDEDTASSTLCSGLGLPMIIGLVLMGLMLVKVDE